MTQLHTAQKEAVLKQRAYYAATADEYDKVHREEGESSLSLSFLLAAIDHLGIKSALDIGSGTGLALLKIKSERPAIRVLGIEPSPELRRVGHSKGLNQTELVDGDALGLPFDDGSFDLVCEFGALHHIPRPSRAVAEMLRVARKAVFVSDCNNFGHGGRLSRLAKQTIRAVGLWPLADLIKTRGRGYTMSEGDGVAYSYSVFDDYKQIARRCQSVHLFNTDGAGASPNLFRTSSHMAILGIKK